MPRRTKIDSDEGSDYMEEVDLKEEQLQATKGKRSAAYENNNRPRTRNDHQQDEGMNHDHLKDEDDNDDDDYVYTENDRATRNGNIHDDRTVPDTLMDERSIDYGQNLDEYKDGSIVRIKLVNFVTYDKVECRPGPNLNMIIGPNGTGKSTIVCGIALGLGGKPDLLGRAKKIQDFIKHGEDTAIVEIELKKTGGNLVIRREISKTNNSCTNTWKLNDRKTKESDIQKLMASMNAQVDNLCSFLPQDKVCEFAQMNAQELLKETERAVGDDSLVASHDRLAGMKTEEKQYKDVLTDRQKNLELMSNRLATLEVEVQRHQERKKFLHQARLIEGIIPFKEFEEMKEKYTTKKAERDEKKRMFDRYSSKLKPLEDKIEDIKKEHKVLDKKHGQLKEQSTKNTGKLKKIVETDLSQLDQDIENLNREKIILHKKEQTRKTNIQNLQALTNKMKRDLDQYRDDLMNNGFMNEEGLMLPTPEPKGEYAEILESDKQISENILRLKAEKRRLDETQSDVRHSTSVLLKEKSKVEEYIQSLNSMEVRKLEAVKKINRDVYDAYKWLETHRNEFQQPVYGPIAMNISAKDPKYARAIENHIKMSNHMTFVTLCKADYDRFNTEFAERQRKRVDCVMFSHLKLENFKVPFSNQELNSLGFDCVLLDVIQGPKEVLSALCQMSNIHQTPVSSKDIKLNLVENNDKFYGFVDSKNRYMVSRRYGVSAIRSDALRNPQMLQNTVDPEYQKSLEDQLRSLQEQLSEKEKEVKAFSHEERKFRNLLDQAEEERNSIDFRRKALFRLKKEYSAKAEALNVKRIELDNLSKVSDNLNDRRDAIDIELKDALKQKIELTKKSAKIQSETLEILRSRNRTVLQTLKLEYELEKAQIEYRNNKDAFQEMELELSRIVTELQALANATRAAKFKLETVLQDYSDQERLEMRETYGEKDIEELRDSFNTFKAKADACPNINMATLEEYEKRKQSVEEMTEQLANESANLKSIQENIETIHNEWYPKLQNLISTITKTFAAAFERIGCAGEVRLAEEEDFNKWGVEVLVKFRDHEKLQVLTGHRQSGGERSVSTILYLMALQEMSKTPFRVVDEINQGMDPRNERMVHGQLVDVACQPNRSQYFLITPKLLPDLKYHRRMKVLCIFNGEYQPSQFNVTGLLNRFKTLNSMNQIPVKSAA